MNTNTIKCMVCDQHHIAGETHDCLKYTEAELQEKQVELLQEIQKEFEQRSKQFLWENHGSLYSYIIQDKINKLEGK